MDWELKESAWDFTNMPPNDDHGPRLAALIESNNNARDFSVDLKLGRLGDTVDETRKVQKCPSNGSGSSKRAKAISGTQNVTCSVDGCVDDLTGCREYHRRHRVCELHSKTPVVSIAGKNKRFCQQCSRFQCVSEFDEEKRSCRKRLDGHNRRRRKPQPEAFYTNEGSLFSTTHQGTRLLQFGVPEAYATSAVPTWPNGADRRFPFLLSNNDLNNYQSVPQVTLHPPRVAHDSAFANMNHHRAHSLLSSPHPIHNSTFNPSASLQFEHPAHHHYFRSPALVPQPTTYDNSFSGIDISMVSLSPDDLLEKGASQVLPFSWKQ